MDDEKGESSNSSSPVFWAMKQNLNNPTEKLILILLANFVQANGSQYRIYPSRQWLAINASCSVQSVQRALNSLKNQGYISWYRTDRSSCYSVNIEKGKLQRFLKVREAHRVIGQSDPSPDVKYQSGPSAETPDFFAPTSKSNLILEKSQSDPYLSQSDTGAEPNWAMTCANLAHNNPIYNPSYDPKYFPNEDPIGRNSSNITEHEEKKDSQQIVLQDESSSVDEAVVQSLTSQLLSLSASAGQDMRELDESSWGESVRSLLEVTGYTPEHIESIWLWLHFSESDIAARHKNDVRHPRDLLTKNLGSQPIYQFFDFACGMETENECQAK